MSDPLAAWRSEFPIVETCTYLVSHSLGAMPRRTNVYLQQFADEWSTRGVRAWHEGWWEIGRTTGDLLAPIVGAPAGTISMHQNVTVAQAIVASCHRYDGPRRRIVMSDLEFPSNMYLFEGFRRYGAEIAYVASDDGIRTNLERLLEAIDERTALVPVSLVLFKSGFIENAAAIVEKAHRVGARVILDIYQAAGTLPLSLEALGVDFAVGGSVKWLCGGPGAGYLYVKRELWPTLEPRLTGWLAHEDPFAFEIGPNKYADNIYRFLNGTPSVPAMYAAMSGYEIIHKIGVEKIREKSIRQTTRLIEIAEDAGFKVNCPKKPAERGGTVVIDVPHGQQVTTELLRRDFLVDYRPGAGIRVAPHFYSRDEELESVVREIRKILDTKAYEEHSAALAH